MELTLRCEPAGRVFALLIDDQRGEFLRHEAMVLDRDTDALHDYRIALRRLRSLLVAGSGVLPRHRRRVAGHGARRLATVSSPVRDIDAMLQDLTDVSDVEPELTVELTRRREIRHAELAASLHSSDHRNFLRSWRELSLPWALGDDPAGPLAPRPAGGVVDDLVWSSFRRARRKGRRAASTDSLERWHDLRVALKRVRYQLDAFDSMFEDAQLAQVRRDLKALQDTLGRLQDIRVQVEILTQLSSGTDAAVSQAARGLIVHLSTESGAAHAACRDAWADFDTRRTRRHLKECLHRFID